MKDSELAWFEAVMMDSPDVAKVDVCPECVEHDDDDSEAASGTVRDGRRGDFVDANYPRYEGPGYRWLMEEDGFRRQHYRPLDFPLWIKASDATHMRDDDPVLGIVMGGKSWALPWWVMKNHHVANLDLAGEPVLITFCEACTSAGAWDPIIAGKRHMFRLDAIYNGTISPLDLETKSAWTGFTGQCFFGPHKGTRLRRLPLVQSSWVHWRSEYPNCAVLDGKGEPRDGHGSGQSPGSKRARTMMKNVLNEDSRIDAHDLVLGVELSDVSRCYPLDNFTAKGDVLHDIIGGQEIVVFTRPCVWQAIAFRREVGGQRFTFVAEDGEFKDVRTGSRWNCFGQAVEGPLSGWELLPVFSGVEKFGIWAAFHPHTEVFNDAKRET